MTYDPKANSRHHTEGRLGRENSESAKANFCLTQGLNMRLRWLGMFFPNNALSGDFTGSQTHCEATHNEEDLRSGNSRENSRSVEDLGPVELARVSRQPAIIVGI